MATTLPLVTVPASSLRERSREIEVPIIGTPAFQTFLDQLTATMFAEDGVGIAAPQVGRNERIFIVNERQGPKAYLNPEILKFSETTQRSEEGCLSVPGVWGVVPRAKKITLRALDRHGRTVEFEAKGFMATVYQHELDHLNGILFIDKATEIVKGSEKINGWFS